MNLADLKQLTDQCWDDDITPRLVEYIKVPAKSPAFDASWAAHGHLMQVVKQAQAWGAAQDIKGLTVELVTIDGRTPCIFFDAPAAAALGSDKTVLFYGHLDKQPEMTGWRQDLGPWVPKIEDGKLYGRGAADDGYALYAALTLISAIDRTGRGRPRCVGLIETCEESGSFDLPAYLDLLSPRLGDVQLVAGLDSTCGNYEQLWIATSLRGLVGGTLTVEILTEGVHSGHASGIVPSSFRIARQLLNRIDDPATGQVLPAAFHAEIPAERVQQAEQAGRILGDAVFTEFPWVSCSHGAAAELGHHLQAQPVTRDPVELILNRSWRPALAVIGAAGFPSIDSAGNVLRPKTTFKLSLRLPPTVDGERATHELKRVLEQEPPYNARVTFTAGHGASGWNAPETAPWLQRACDRASQAVWGKESAWMGGGGTIPFMSMLAMRFPKAQFLTTGVLGPQSNAHGPNEFLHLNYAKQLTVAVADIVTQVPA